MGLWKKWCQICLNVTKTNSFSSTSTKKTYKINHLFNCNEKCVVYVLTSRVCLKQYVSETVISSEVGGTTVNPVIENI